MGRLIDHTGQVFGRLTVIKREPVGTNKERSVWNCLCLCGKTRLVTGPDLRRGDVRSCGCLKEDQGKLYGFDDLTGKIFGKLTVIKRIYEKKNSKWICRCSCGNTCSVGTGSLSSGNTKSCGCLLIDSIRLPQGEVGLNNLFSQYKSQARKRKKEFSLTKEEFALITKDICFYCDAPPSQSYACWRSSISKETVENGRYFYNGIDRVDNSVGYIKENVVACCKICNRAKGALSMPEFLNWIGNISGKTLKGVDK